MPQVLKGDIRRLILAGAREEFSLRGYQAASMRAIARRAGVSPGLIYTYYPGKEALLDAVLAPVRFDWEAVLASSDHDHPGTGGLSRAELDCLCRLIDCPAETLILLEGCAGTPYAREKARLIAAIEAHLLAHSARDALFLHIVACGFVDGLLQIIRCGRGKDWSLHMLRQLADMYFKGIGP